ncbi:alcohol dehydrogenase catalytic domain-containing protein [Agromyces bauzanensis]|uniref:Alcohol dehydrogenase n=1 Tax=Agromyces bauzanensis TaxID=1308924 RepID=A0A917USE3_9MICO|nr:alcohol dehydrogenase catalytic domain-containing protein [Agromyces bauzanensis]GGJ82035.1 alcohol dehydrogenase [Agromyces bauzanensis]
MHTITRVGDLDVIVKPSPVAMVWNEPGRPHDALAAPGVRLAPGEALVEVELATICGSDVRVARGEEPAPVPLVLGHEAVGRVVAIGEGARRVDGVPLELGDRVVWSTTVSCGECDRCRRGVPQACRTLGRYGHERVHRGWELSGGFATHVQLRRGTGIVRAPEDIPSRVLAPSSCTAATAFAALDAASARVGLDGALVLVTGAGLVGLTVAAMAVEAGAEVIVSEPDASRREFARRFGAVPVDPGARSTSPDGLGTALAAFERRGFGEVHVAVEASGAASAVRTAVNALGAGGVAVLIGTVPAGSEVCLDAESLVRRLVTVQSVRDATGEQLRQAVAFLERSWRSFPFDELVGSTHPLADLDQAIAEAAEGSHVRVGVAPGRRPV